MAHCAMFSLTIALPASLEAALTQRAKDAGARLKEEYLIALVEADCGAQELDRVLASRARGPFSPLEMEWKDRVRALAASRASE